MTGGQPLILACVNCSVTLSEVVETEEENGEEEETVEEVGTQVDNVDGVATADFSVITSLTLRDLMKHCLSCFLFLILS